MNPHGPRVRLIGRFSPTVLVVLLVAACAAAESAFAQQDIRRPKYGLSATRLYHAREFIQNNRAADFWALMPYYVPQQNDRACSTASVAMVLNALRADRELAADEQLVTQASLLKAVGNSAWNRQVAADGEGVTRDVGFKPSAPIEEGVARFVAWYRSYFEKK